MKAIQWGTLLIPVLDDFEFTGEPVATPNIPNTGTPADHFASGTTLSAATYAPGNVQQSVNFTDTILVLHDNTFINIDLQQTPGQGATGVTAILTATHNDAAVSLTPGLVNISLFPNRRSIDQTIIEDFVVNAVAYSYSFPNASTEYRRVKGYVIYAVQRVTQTTISTGAFTVRYNNNVLYINCPYYNRSNNWETYLEETDIPDPPAPDEPPFDPSEDKPYAPNIDDTSDLIDLPSDPVIGVTNAGFINVYKPSAGALQGLGDILFPNVASATDIVDAVIKLCETLANQNLINYVIDCHVVPATPVIGSNANIKVGFRDTGISVPVVTSDYCNISCGSLNITEYFGGFADYMATRSKIYLPFIGFVDTKPEYWQSGTIAVDYKFNIIDGSFMAYIRSASSKSQLNGSVIAQYAGNACMHFPMTGVNYSNMVSGLVGAAISASTAGSSTAVLGSALTAANTIAQGGNVQQSNSYNATAAILGVRTPYMIIERSVPSYSTKYMHDVGYPSNIYASLANVSGFTVIEDIDLSGIPLTQSELDELRGLLKEGVYF